MKTESRMKRWDNWLRTKFDTTIARIPALGLKNQRAVLVVVVAATVVMIAVQVATSF